MLLMAIDRALFNMSKILTWKLGNGSSYDTFHLERLVCNAPMLSSDDDFPI
jgi:hypothetical protein